ncbi:MAG: hypothetical protein ACXADH_02895 [Candidatus Kariarchaeaceae archaeon]
MGVHPKGINYINEISNVTFGRDVFGRIAVIGHLNVRSGVTNYGEPYGGISLEYYYKRMGLDAVSLDIQGFKGRALPVNLCEPIEDEDLLGKFDFTIDAGTSEHIINQYQLFKNVFRLCRIGGIMVHILPYEKCTPGHGYWKYTSEFFHELRNSCNYTFIDRRISTLKYFNISWPPWRESIFVAFQKTDESVFPREEDFNLPIRDYGDKHIPLGVGLNPKG